MIYNKPSFYHQFHCIADKCPASCCLAWQIMIDEDSLRRYSSLETPFGNRLLNSIDWEEGSFLQYDGRCAFLNDEDLCDIHCELGEEGLCSTCKNYPRHVEEYDGIREYSLSLSCPEAARMILSEVSPLQIITKGTKEAEWDEDFDEFDDLLFDQLLSARDRIFELATNRSLPISDRMELILFYGKALQEKVNEDDIFTMNDVFDTAPKNKGYAFETAINDFSLLYELEFLYKGQKELLDRAMLYLKNHRNSDWQSACIRTKKEELACEQLLMFFLYTYFLGSVYDDCVYSKVALSVYSVRFIMIEYCSAISPDMDEEQRFQTLITTAYRFAREVEHSDPNLNHLEESLNI